MSHKTQIAISCFTRQCRDIIQVSEKSLHLLLRNLFRITCAKFYKKQLIFVEVITTTILVCSLWDSINMKYVRNCISPADNRYSASASVINDFLLVKSKLADVSDLSSTDVDFIIDTLCVSQVCSFVCLYVFFFFFFFPLCVQLVRFS